MRIRGYDLTRTRRGRWLCDCCFKVTTSAQFSDEEHAIRGRGRWLITALIHSRILASRRAKVLRAKPGERLAKGWAE